MEKDNQIIARAGMLIRKPVAEVFEAFVDPSVTTKFWFSKASDRLQQGRRIEWHWEMFGVATRLDVKAVEQDKRILIEWDVDDKPTSVEWTFATRGQGQTFVAVTNWGFSGDANEIVEQALDSQGGFNLVLAGLKAYLEHGIELNLVADHKPEALVKS